MTTIRIRLDKLLYKNIENQYKEIFVKEYNHNPTPSQVIILALLELESLKTGREIKLNIKKNGKIIYKLI
jgi:hypothetical protein